MKKHALSLFASVAMSMSMRRPQFVLDIDAAQTENADYNVPGTADEVYIIPVSSVTAFGTLQSSPTYDTAYNITAAHTLDSGKKWIKVDLAQNSGRYTFEGPKKGQGNFKQKIEGRIPGMSATNLGFVNNISRVRVYAIAFNRAKNVAYHLGAAGTPAYMDLMGDTGLPEDNELGIKFEINSTTPFLYRWATGNTLTTY